MKEDTTHKTHYIYAKVPQNFLSLQEPIFVTVQTTGFNPSEHSCGCIFPVEAKEKEKDWVCKPPVSGERLIAIFEFEF